VTPEHPALSPTDFHVLLVLAEQELYGYAILQAVQAESQGAVSPEIGSLYRVLARLVSEGLVEEVEPPADAPDANRGRPRRYYGLTKAGREVARAEVGRLEHVLHLASRRALSPGSARS
jgi:DNA-binding PadR family transcriptional regulator